MADFWGGFGQGFSPAYESARDRAIRAAELKKQRKVRAGERAEDKEEREEKERRDRRRKEDALNELLALRKDKPWSKDLFTSLATEKRGIGPSPEGVEQVDFTGGRILREEGDVKGFLRDSSLEKKAAVSKMLDLKKVSYDKRLERSSGAVTAMAKAWAAATRKGKRDITTEMDKLKRRYSDDPAALEELNDATLTGKAETDAALNKFFRQTKATDKTKENERYFKSSMDKLKTLGAMSYYANSLGDEALVNKIGGQSARIIGGFEGDQQSELQNTFNDLNLVGTEAQLAKSVGDRKGQIKFFRDRAEKFLSDFYKTVPPEEAKRMGGRDNYTEDVTLGGDGSEILYNPDEHEGQPTWKRLKPEMHHAALTSIMEKIITGVDPMGQPTSYQMIPSPLSAFEPPTQERPIPSASRITMERLDKDNPELKFDMRQFQPFGKGGRWITFGPNSGSSERLRDWMLDPRSPYQDYEDDAKAGLYSAFGIPKGSNANIKKMLEMHKRDPEGFNKARGFLNKHGWEEIMKRSPKPTDEPEPTDESSMGDSKLQEMEAELMGETNKYDNLIKKLTSSTGLVNKITGLEQAQALRKRIDDLSARIRERKNRR